jgi:hypothetical protein
MLLLVLSKPHPALSKGEDLGEASTMHYAIQKAPP